MYHLNLATYHDSLPPSSHTHTHTHTQTGKIVGKFKCSTRVMYLAVCGQLLYVAQHSGTLVVIDLEVRVPDLSVFHL